MKPSVHKPEGFDETLSANVGIYDEIAEAEERDRERELEAKRIDNALVTIAKTESGKTVINWILELCGVDESCTSTDGMTMMAMSARRDIGLQIKARIKAAKLSEHFEDHE
jgi:hypothetical protein|nr:MAG TPA: hypothetical protein [Caudoviricetes sp.]